MSDQIFYFVLVVIAGIALYSFFFSRKAIVKRKLKGTKQLSMSEVMNGEHARIQGTIVYAGKSLTAPLSGRRCSYYYILVEEKRSSGKSSSWHNLIEEEVAGDVVIRDGNSYAIIDTNMVKSYLVQDAQYSSGFLNDASPVLEAYLKKHGQKSTDWLGFNDTLRYKEGILEEGELLTVVGKVNWMRTAEYKLNVPAQKILLISAMDTEPVYFSDDAV